MEKTTKMPEVKKPVAKRKSVRSLFGDFFLNEIKDIYWAEKSIIKTLPKMKKMSTSPELAKAFEQHLAVTETHVKRLEQIFDLLNETPKAKKCDAMDGIIREAESTVEETPEGTSLRDVALILCAQKVEHYEITTYGSLHQLAQTMGKNDIAELLAATLQEEKDTDKHLSKIAIAHINADAENE